MWAYMTYILMMTVYTCVNVPYGAMLGVMTDDTNEKTDVGVYDLYLDDDRLYVCERALRSDAGCDD